MDEIFKLFFQDPNTRTLVVIIITTLFVVILFFFIDAYLDGREITFWPPKIGKKNSTPSNEKAIQDSRKYNILTIPELVVSEINETDIGLSLNALSDCTSLEMSPEKVKDFILEEINRHPILFRSSFSSLPFIYLNHIVILLWDGNRIIVERILLNRHEANHEINLWFKCASLYRRATAFSYRFEKTKAIIRESEISQIINLYKKLLQSITEFASIDTNEDVSGTSTTSLFNSLLNDAEFAFHRDNQDSGVVHLEALLSSIHKYLISNTPKGISATPNTPNNQDLLTPKLLGQGQKAALVVEDDKDTLDFIATLLRGSGWRVATAENGEKALMAIFENNYDLIITDIMMPGVTGFDVINGARVICPKTKLLVITALSNVTIQKITELGDEIYCLCKPFNVDELIELIDKLTNN